MLIFYAIVVTGLAVWLWFKLCESKENVEGLTAELEQLTTEKEFYRTTIISMHEKPIYALLNEEQIHRIGTTIAEYVKEPKWLN